MTKFNVGDRLIDREFNDKRCVVVDVLPGERVVVHYDSDPVGVTGDWPTSDFELVDDSVPAVSDPVRFAPGDFALCGSEYVKIIHVDEDAAWVANGGSVTGYVVMLDTLEAA